MGDFHVYLITTLGAGSTISLLREGIALAIVGLLVVFTALSVTAVMIAVLNRFVGTPEAKSGSTKGVGSGLTDERRLRAVLTAAAATALGASRVKINQISLKDS